MIQAAVFDMDGTMVNTEHLWGDVMRRLAERYGKTFDEGVRVLTMGKRDYDSLSVFRDFFSIDVPVEELITVRQAMVLEDLSMVEANPGLFELLALLERLSIKKAVATSSFPAFTERILSRFELVPRFDAVVTGGEVRRGKPFPDIFIEAARRISVPPENCLVLEDAQNGVEAAAAASMRVVAIPHDASRTHDFSKAHRVIASMREIDEAFLREIAA